MSELSAGYRDRCVLHEIDARFGQGLHLLLGPNGAGKTTLLRCLAGVLPPRRGQVRIAGRDPHADPAVKLLVGLSSHRVALAPRLSVVDNLHYWARILDVLPRQRQSSVGRVLELLELGGVAERLAGSLSRGQAQRVSLARALLHDPPVLLLDEPFAGLDPAVAMAVRGHLRELASTGRTLLVSTHELAEAGVVCDDVALLREGRIIARGEVHAIRARLGPSVSSVRIRARGDLTGVLERLGYHGVSGAAGSITVQVGDESAVEALVSQLVYAGLAVREVAKSDDTLQQAYLQLEQQGCTTHG